MKNPYGNAVLAFVYVVSIAFFVQIVPSLLFEDIGLPALGIAVMLSLLVLSVALMGFLFFFTPLTLVVEQKFKESAEFFTKTVATFACLVIFLLLVIFLV